MAAESEIIAALNKGTAAAAVLLNQITTFRKDVPIDQVVRALVAFDDATRRAVRLLASKVDEIEDASTRHRLNRKVHLAENRH